MFPKEKSLITLFCSFFGVLLFNIARLTLRGLDRLAGLEGRADGPSLLKWTSLWKYDCVFLGNENQLFILMAFSR